ncbi:phage tail protein [Aeromonas allosaccharophila]|uniref:phage tail protein n=1 Tax=Aeromonas allosaccharophila TaxID=656 RepID=UPI001F0766BB|nr:phage tail protein [Aeromonas allosaccharophila]WDO03826.1 phage tail protein [Aeromonas allosaccharophila]
MIAIANVSDTYKPLLTSGAGMATGASGLYKINSIASVGLDFDAQMSKVQALTRLQKGSAEPVSYTKIPKHRLGIFFELLSHSVS